MPTLGEVDGQNIISTTGSSQTSGNSMFSRQIDSFFSLIASQSML